MKACITIIGRVAGKQQKVLKNGQGVTNLYVDVDGKNGTVQYVCSGGGRMSEVCSAADQGDTIMIHGSFEPIMQEDPYSCQRTCRYFNIFSSEMEILIKDPAPRPMDDIDDMQPVRIPNMPRMVDYGDDPEFYEPRRSMR